MIYLIGYPADVGGANTEIWHTIKLWRRFGAEVSVVPTWSATLKWERRLAAIGVPTLPSRNGKFSAIPDDSICVSFCNPLFARHSATLANRGCRLIYAPCMSYWSNAERKRLENTGPFDRYVFQSQSQDDLLYPLLEQHGVPWENCQRIPGAFDTEEFPFRYRARPSAKDPFVVGRLCRPDPAKFAQNTWDLFGQVRRQVPGLQVRIMGWSNKVAAKIGKPPPWAEVREKNTMPVADFLGGLHCMIAANDRDPANSAATENWPRVGLEAMSAGVPIVADCRGGWPEMIDHLQTGCLAATDQELVENVSLLAANESWRAEIVRVARHDLATRLADPQPIWAAWRQLFKELESDHPTAAESTTPMA